MVDVNAGDRMVGARRCRSPVELASNNHALDGPRRAPERASWSDLETASWDTSKRRRSAGLTCSWLSLLLPEHLDEHVESRMRQLCKWNTSCT